MDLNLKKIYLLQTPILFIYHFRIASRDLFEYEMKIKEKDTKLQLIATATRIEN